MLCPSCGAEIPNDSYYCPECGGQLDDKAFNVVPASGHSSGGSSGSYESADYQEPLGLADSLLRPFKDPEWVKKVLIAGLFGLIPFIGQILGMLCFMGIQIEYARRILNRDRSTILPDWSDIGNYLMPGVMLWVINLIYGLGLNVVCGITFIPFIGGIAAMAKQVEGSSPETIMGLVFGTLMIPILISSVIISIFSMFAFLIPIFYARNRDFGDAFKVGDMFRMIMADLGSFILITLALFGISLGAALVGFIPLGIIFVVLNFIPFVGQFISFFIMGIVGMAFSFTFLMITTSAIGEYYYKNRHVVEI